MPSKNPLIQYLPFLVGQLFKTPEGYLVIDKIDCESKYKAWATSLSKWNGDILNDLGCCGRGFYPKWIRPVLRKFDSITDREAKDGGWGERRFFLFFMKEKSRGGEVELYMNDMLYLLKKGFDVFDLIRKGLAEDRELVQDKITKQHKKYR